MSGMLAAARPVETADVAELAEVVPVANPLGFAVSFNVCVEAATNFPYWTSVWDHRKGEIDADTKLYVQKMLDVAGRYSVPLQFYVVGSALEADDVDYLKRAAAEGHGIGNHTYTHLHVKAKESVQIQYLYRDQPWRAGGRTVQEILRDEIRCTTLAIRERLGVEPLGFRSPGGFPTQLRDVPDVRHTVASEGFRYVSSGYRLSLPRDCPPTQLEIAAAVEQSVAELQPVRYVETASSSGEADAGGPAERLGLLEISMMGMSDIDAFRNLRLPTAAWLEATRVALQKAQADRLVLSLLLHPSVLAARDPFCETLELCARMSASAGGAMATNDTIAAQLTAAEG
jgi:hypothetical protein